MKKIVGITLLSGLAGLSFADSFRDFNNNAYLEYNYVAPNSSAYGTQNSYGVGATAQTKNNIWINANASDGIGGSGGNTYNSSIMNVRGGYALQLPSYNSEFQIIPYAQFSNGVLETTQYNSVGVGVLPEYRLMESLKLAVDVGLGNTNYGNPSASQIYYLINPQVQYNVDKTVMLGIGYSYSSVLNAPANPSSQYGNSTITAKVGYLF